MIGVRRAFLGPMDQVYVEGYERGVNKRRRLHRLPKLRLGQLLYSSLFQAGVDKIEFLFPLEGVDTTLAWAQERLVEKKSSQWVHFFAITDEVFRIHRARRALKRNYEVLQFFNFIVGILTSARDRRNLIYADQMPDLSRLSRILPVELILPARLLLSSLTPVSVTGVLPSVEIDRENVFRFEEVLLSRGFLNYRDAHRSFEQSVEPSGRMRNFVRAAAVDLHRKYPSLLRTRRVLVETVPDLAAALEPLCTGLPGKVMISVSKMLQTWRRSHKTLVIYPINDTLLEIVGTQRVAATD